MSATFSQASGVEQQTAEQCLLGLYRMRRSADFLKCARIRGALWRDRALESRSEARSEPCGYSSAMITTVTGESTSACRCTCTTCSPSMRSGPFGRRTSLRAMAIPARVAASAISAVPIEPKSLPSRAGLGGDRQTRTRRAPQRDRRRAQLLAGKAARAPRGAAQTFQHWRRLRASPCPRARGNCGRNPT